MSASRKFGVFLGLIAVAGIAIGGWMAMQEEGASVLGRGRSLRRWRAEARAPADASPPPPEPPPPPRPRQRRDRTGCVGATAANGGGRDARPLRAATSEASAVADLVAGIAGVVLRDLMFLPWFGPGATLERGDRVGRHEITPAGGGGVEASPDVTDNAGRRFRFVDLVLLLGGARRDRAGVGRSRAWVRGRAATIGVIAARPRGWVRIEPARPTG